MKIVDLTDEKSEREPVAALLDFGDGPAVLLKTSSGSLYSLYHNNSMAFWGAGWSTVDKSKVLKFYYPGDRITIEV